MTTEASNVVAGDLLTISDVAALLGLASRQAADYQVRRAGFPAPLRLVDPGRIRIWSRRAVLAWAEQAGRAVHAADVEPTAPRPGAVVLTLPTTINRAG